MTNKKDVKTLSKADLLKGTDSEEEVYIEVLDANIVVRPLSSAEFAEIDAIKNKGFKLKGEPAVDRKGNPDPSKTKMNMEIDMEEMAKAEFEADAKAVYYGVSGSETNKWKLEEVKQIQPASAVKGIAQKIYEVSGVLKAQQERLAMFRGQQGGTKSNKS